MKREDQHHAKPRFSTTEIGAVPWANAVLPPSNSHIRLLRIGPVLERTGDKRSTFYQRVKDKLMPPAISTGPRAVAWLEAEVEAVLRARSRASTDEEVRALVQQLVKSR